MATPNKSGGTNRSLGTRSSSQAPSDPNSAVLKSTGKIAATPSGSGAQRKAPLNTGTRAPGPRVVGIKGRTVAGTNKTIRTNGQ